MAQTGLPGHQEIAAPVHTAGIADGTAMVLRLASSGRLNARVLGRNPDELVFQVSAGRSQRTIVRTGLLEEPVLSGGSGGPGRLRPRELLSPSPEEGVEGLGHDARGARAAPYIRRGRGPHSFIWLEELHAEDQLRGSSSMEAVKSSAREAMMPFLYLNDTRGAFRSVSCSRAVPSCPNHYWRRPVGPEGYIRTADWLRAAGIPAPEVHQVPSVLAP